MAFDYDEYIDNTSIDFINKTIKTEQNIDEINNIMHIYKSMLKQKKDSYYIDYVGSNKISKRPEKTKSIYSTTETKISVDDKNKCVVDGCTNYDHQGKFVGKLCSPCHSFLIFNRAVIDQEQNKSHASRLFKMLIDDYLKDGGYDGK